MALLIKERRVAAENPPSPEAKVVVLQPADDPAALAGKLEGLQRIDIAFPKFGDGRGFSTAQLLRTRYGYKGELRAVGHITRDHLPFLERVGFDSYVLREGEDPARALTAFGTFSSWYQRT